jgi:hypothetical protein
LPVPTGCRVGCRGVRTIPRSLVAISEDTSRGFFFKEDNTSVTPSNVNKEPSEAAGAGARVGWRLAIPRDRAKGGGGGGHKELCSAA